MIGSWFKLCYREEREGRFQLLQAASLFGLTLPEPSQFTSIDSSLSGFLTSQTALHSQPIGKQVAFGYPAHCALEHGSSVHTPEQERDSRSTVWLHFVEGKPLSSRNMGISLPHFLTTAQ